MQCNILSVIKANYNSKYYSNLYATPLTHLPHLEPCGTASLAVFEAASSSVHQTSCMMWLHSLLLLSLLSSPSLVLSLLSWIWTARWSLAASCWSGGPAASGRSSYTGDNDKTDKGGLSGGGERMAIRVVIMILFLKLAAQRLPSS